MKVLVVEDSKNLTKALVSGLTNEGYSVVTADNGHDGLAQILHDVFDVVILDVMLPGPDGFQIIKEIRSRNNATNILLLTAKTDVKDRVKGLELGADDYLCKPFAFEELLARLRLLTRRSAGHKQPVIKLNNVVINLSLRKLTTEKGDVNLTTTEFEVVECLVLNLNTVISINQIIDRIFDLNSFISHNAIEVHISSIRKKLKTHGVENLIKNKRGFGFYIEKPDAS